MNTKISTSARRALRWLAGSNGDKILIANRGEIACRIIRTAKKMGMKTVAVYSIADVNTPHVKLADETVCIGPPPVSESYLNEENILNAIRETNATSIHPGYGFLSESPKFVKMLEKEGISFVGPSADVIFKMGDKLESKRAAQSAGVRIIPGFDGIVKDAEECLQIAEKIGYPVMIKASAGGGGKGMRIATCPEEVLEGYKLSTSEAVSSFGDGRMLVEKYIKNPRHIEIQVLCDKHGNAIHLNERECSIQRRNQKVIEEAPSVFLDDSTRQAMGNQAVSLCKTLKYSSAGTVEFLVDENRQFYFLEMNTRLQVEHPITEAITGIDIVEQMIRIAKGETLSIKQEDVKIDGWAIESRVYAEDPSKQFGLPSIGRLYKYREPKEARCDSGIEEGSEISIHYDPLICKLVCHGRDRKEAIDKSIKALDSYVIRGVTHNIPLLRDVLSSDNFVSGKLNTNFLQELYPDGFNGAKIEDKDRHKLIALTCCLYVTEELRSRELLNAKQYLIHAKSSDKWRLVVSLNGKDDEVFISQCNDSFLIKIANREFCIEKNLNLAAPLVTPCIDGTKIVAQLYSKNTLGEFKIVYMGTMFSLRVLTKEAADFLHMMPKVPKKDLTKIVKSPMPGVIHSVSCKKGDSVQEAQELCVIEAMKMQNSITAPAMGIIKNVHITEGKTVGDGEILIEFE